MGKQGNRDTSKYHLKDGKTIVHRGITNNPDRREVEHQTEFPNTTLHKIGRNTTRDAALKWEREGGKRPYGK